MLRLIWRTLLILLIAGLVSGGLYLLAQTDAGRALLGGTSNRLEGNRANPGFAGASEGIGRGRNAQSNRKPGFDSERAPRVLPSGEMRERGEHEQISWTRGIAGLTRNFAIIAILTIGVVMVQQTWGWVSRRTRAKAV